MDQTSAVDRRDSLVSCHVKRNTELLAIPVEFQSCTERFCLRYCGFFNAIPARYVVVFMGFWCWFLFNSLRMTISLTIVAMVNWSQVMPARNSTPGEVAECIFEKGRVLVDGPIAWDVDEQSSVMAAYFAGLASSQFPGGRLSEIYGAKWVIMLGTLLAALMNFLSPLASHTNFFFTLVVMALKGVGQGVIAPAFSSIAGKWFPASERSTLVTICVVGMPLGGFVTLITSGYLATSFLGWEIVYYLWATVALVWAFFWYLLIYDTPLDHPAIHHQELFRIMSLRTQEAVRLRKKPAVPIKYMITSLPAWAFILVGFASFWTISLYNIVLPTYMGTTLQFDLKTNGIMSSLPQLAQAFFLVFSVFMSNILLKKHVLSTTGIRKACVTIGLLGFVSSLLIVSNVGCDRVINVAMLSLGFGMSGFNFAAIMVIPVELTPRYAGTLNGIMSVFGSVSGLIIPTIVGIISGDRKVTLQDWYIVFYISAILCFISVVFFLAFGSCTVQPWNYPELFRKVKFMDVKKQSLARLSTLAPSIRSTTRL